MSDEHKAIAVIERGDSRAMSPVVSMGMEMMRVNPNPETLRELLAVQKDWEANEARKAFAAALVALKRDLPTVIARDKTVAFEARGGKTSYTHASLAGVMDAITGALTQHGFSLAWKPSTTSAGVSVTCRLTHAAGHFEEGALTAPSDTSGSKSPAQAIASTITLLQRYTALSLLGIATADMKDPEGDKEPEPDAVDSARNLKAVGWLVNKGRTRIAAEEFLARSVADWTSADLDKLRQWAVKSPTPDDPASDRSGQ